MQLPDMNLLVALDALLDEGSVVGAARRMNLSPAAMSRTLTRVREAIGDPILVRAGRGLVPTPKALELWPEIRATLERLQTTLAPRVFAPGSAQHSFVLTMADATAAELDRLVADFPDDSALDRELFDVLGCSHLPRPDLGGPTVRVWLGQIAAFLRAGARDA